MRGRKYLMLACATALTGVALPAVAQTGTAPKPPAAADSGRRMMDPIGRMLAQREQLKLTNDQVQRLEQIRAKYRDKYKDHVEQMRRSHEARSALRAGMDSARSEVTAVLTPEQQKQVEAMREQWRREWREAHRGRHGGKHGKHHDHEGSTDG